MNAPAKIAPRWVKRWRDEIAAEPDAPGVWRRKAGGFRIRGRVVDPRTGRRIEVCRTLPDVTRVRDAVAVLAAELATIRAGRAEGAAVAVPRFEDYAATIFERKITDGRILSASGRRKWDTILRTHLLPAFGRILVDKLTSADIEAWKATMGPRIRAGEASPNTGNTILGVLRVITAAAADEFDLRDPARRVRPFDTRAHRTYTAESPNSLRPEDVPRFLDVLRARYPQHYAFVFLGFCAGLRPSSLRPIRRRGPSSDVKWDESTLLVRRSQTCGDEIMSATKTGRDQVLHLPPSLLDVLRAHADGIPEGPARESELLFPTEDGGYQSGSCLARPFVTVAKAIGLAYRVSPRAMRRTFQDLAREAGVRDIVTRAISGHATESMQRHYSTVRGQEVADGLARVIDLATARDSVTAAKAGLRSAAIGEHDRAEREGVLCAVRAFD